MKNVLKITMELWLDVDPVVLCESAKFPKIPPTHALLKLTHLLACMADVVMKNGAHTKPYFQRCVSRSEPTGTNLCQWRTASSVSASIGCDLQTIVVSI